MLRIVIIILDILVFWQFNSFCQASDNVHYFDQLTIKEGLAHNTVNCIIQDKYGYIWIGTINGLNKYDGYNFDTYNSVIENKKNRFLGKNISALLEDSKGNLWVGTNKYGINLKLNNSNEFFNFKDNKLFKEISKYRISSFFEDKEGNIWISSIGGGLMKYNQEDNSSSLYNTQNGKLSSNTVFSTIQDNNGIIWTATLDDGINYLDKKDKFTKINSNIDEEISGYRKILKIKGNDLWIGTEGSGLFKMDLAAKSFNHYAFGFGKQNLSSEYVRDLIFRNENEIFIATDGGGLNILNTKSNVISKYKHNSDINYSINSNALLCMMIDKTENIWIGSFNGGINIINNNKNYFESVNLNQTYCNPEIINSVLSIIQSSDGNIWVGTDGEGIKVFNPYKGEIVNSFLNNERVSNSLSGNVVKTIFEDSKNRIWIGMFGGGLDMYNPRNKSFKHLSPLIDDSLLSLDNVWDILETKNNEILIASIGSGLYFYSDNGGYQNISLNPNDSNSLVSNDIVDVFEDDKGIIWIGTLYDGLDIYNPKTGKFQHFRHNSEKEGSLSNDEVRAIFQDSKGRIWIGTEGGGINVWIGDDKFEYINKKTGLLSNNIMGIIEDNDGYIWVSSFEGISRINPIDNKIDNFDFHNQDRYNQFNQMSLLLSDNNKLYFGGIDGINSINPESVIKYKSDENIKITSISILNNRVINGFYNGRKIYDGNIETTQEILLNYTDKSFNIKFSTFDYTKPLELIFDYKLENFDQDWQQTPKGSPGISYTNLNPGKYNLRIKHDKLEKSILIKVKPPFWDTFWFKGLVTFILILAGYILFRLYVNRQEELHAKKILLSKLEILKLHNEKIENDMKISHSKLLSYSAKIAYKDNFINEIKEKLNLIEQNYQYEVKKIIRKLDSEIKKEDYWEQFKIYFDKVDKNFVNSIAKNHANLTNNDLRLCSLLRLNLSTKEIATLLNISVRGVEKGRYRLKKRLDLPSDQDLQQYIISFDKKN